MLKCCGVVCCAGEVPNLWGTGWHASCFWTVRQRRTHWAPYTSLPNTQQGTVITGVVDKQNIVILIIIIGITLLTTWLLAVSPQQEFPSLKSRCGYFVLTGKDRTASLLFSGRAASRYAGTWLSRVHWLSHTLTERLLRQVQQQRWQPLAKRRSTSTSVLVTSLSQLR